MLLTINVVAYVVWQVVFIHIDAARAFVGQHLMLHPALPDLLFEPWQVITYSFLHLEPGFGGFLHVLFNMLWLFWIGKEYEDLHGPHRLLSAYVFGALGGALLTVVLHALFPGATLFSGSVHGASAAVLGVLTTVAVRYPFKSIGLFLLGTVRLIYIVIGFLALDILFLAGSNTSVSAHLGGALFGFLLAKVEGGGTDLSGWARLFFPGSRRRGTGRRGGAGGSTGFFGRMGAWKTRGEPDKGEAPPRRPATVHPIRPPVEAPRRAPQDEVDRILDKISDQGYEALTDEEKRILYEASKR